MTLIYYLQTQTVWFMKLKWKMFMKIFIKIKVSNSKGFHKIQSFFDPVNKQFISKMKDELVKNKK